MLVSVDPKKHNSCTHSTEMCCYVLLHGEYSEILHLNYIGEMIFYNSLFM